MSSWFVSVRYILFLLFFFSFLCLIHRAGTVKELCFHCVLKLNLCAIYEPKTISEEAILLHFKKIAKILTEAVYFHFINYYEDRRVPCPCYNPHSE